MFSMHLTRIFSIPGRVDPELRLFFWLFVVWFICRKSSYRHKIIAYRRWILLGESLLYIVLAFTFIHIIVALTQPGSLLILYYNAREAIFIIFGYFMLKQIFLSSSRDSVNSFIKSIIVLSTTCMLIFLIHQGLGIELYPYTEYSTFSFLQVEMTRTFTIMSPLLLTVYAFSLVTAGTRRSSILLLLITLSAIMISYTRGMVLIGIIMILLYTFNNLGKIQTFKTTFIKTVFPILVIGIGLVSFVQLLPKQYSYLSSRVGEVTGAFSGHSDNSVGSVTRVDNVSVREEQMNDLYRKASGVQRIYGNGYSQEMAGSSPLMTDIYDSEWQALFIQFGIVGMVLFTIIQGIYLLLAIRMSKSKYQEKNIVGSVIALLIVGNFVWAFTSLTYFSYQGVALSFWPFAFLVSEAKRDIPRVSSVSKCNN